MGCKRSCTASAWAEPDQVRRLLIVSYFFPPVGGIGVERVLKHVSYLPEFGWEPVVVAPANSGYRIIDPASLSRIPPGTEVHRSRTLEPSHIRRGVVRLVRGRRPDPGAATARGADEGDDQRSAGGLLGAANAVWRRVVPLVFFPDEEVLWLPGAVRAGVRAHRSSPVDAIFSSSPPITSHLAAGRVAGRIGVPWVADFRDPWIGNAFARRLPAPHRAVQRRLERWIVEGATRVVLATERMRAQYAERYPGHADRFVHLPNGYDLADLESAAGDARLPSEPGTFRIVYAGSVYGEHELTVFLDGVELLLARRPELRSRLRVEFVGWLSAANEAIARRRLPSLDPVVRHLGFVPRSEAIARQRSADAGMVLLSDMGDRSLFATSKLYEYLGLDLPILAIVPPGEVRTILADLDWGVVADPTTEGVASGIEAIMSAPPADRRADPERRYERRALSGRMAKLLDEISVER
jgi:glycosyltransferase involved in cell wall biosynthesis